MTNVRYFAYGFDDQHEMDIVEVDETQFLGVKNSGDYNIEYERHTIFANGVNQICLTVQNIDEPIEE